MQADVVRVLEPVLRGGAVLITTLGAVWYPTTWAEVQALIGQAETDTLDFKQKLPATDKRARLECAKDLAAMSINGGAIIYGIAETDSVAAAIEDVDFAGTPERFQQIVGSNATPAVPITVECVADPDSDGRRGVVVVAVAPSRTAPHMVRDQFPVRRGTTTETLTEPEIARLYERRFETVRARPTAETLRLEHVSHPGFDAADNLPGVGRLQLVLRPEFADSGHPAHPKLWTSLANASHVAQERLEGRLKQRPRWEGLSTWDPYGLTGWASLGVVPSAITVREQVGSILVYPSTFAFTATVPRAVFDPDTEQTPLYYTAREDLIGSNLIAMLAVAGEWYGQIPDVGGVVGALSIENWGGSVAHRATSGRTDISVEGMRQTPGDSYLESAVTDVRELRAEPGEVARRLLARWLVPFYEFPDLIDDLLLTS